MHGQSRPTAVDGIKILDNDNQVTKYGKDVAWSLL